MRALVFLALALVTLAYPAIAQEGTPDPREDLVVSDDLSALPEPVRNMRDNLIAATQSGDIEALRAIMDSQATPPRVSFGDPEDAIASLKSASVDGEGLEILAILANALDAPYGIIDASGEKPIYTWPYIAGMTDITALTPSQKVDAYRLLSPDQFEDMVSQQGWYHWRVLISADGIWLAFVAGD